MPSPTRRQLLALGGGGLLPAWAQANEAPTPTSAPPEVRAVWPQAQRQGQALFRYFGLAIYDIALWAPAPVSPEGYARQPLALVLGYQRALSGARIAERSLEEMRRAGPLAPADEARWLAAMRLAFPDVQAGERLTGLLLAGGQPVRLFHQGRLRAEWMDAALAERFFGIWLAPHTSAPALRRELLGAGA